LKLVFFLNDNFLWSSSIELKFWAHIEDIYVMCLLKFQGVWSCQKQVASHFVFRSLFEVISSKLQNLSFYEVKWAEILKDGSRHSCSCFIKISDWSKVICERCSFAELLWQKFVLRRCQNKFSKWSKYNLGELERRSLKIRKRKYIIQTSYKSVVCNHVLNTIRNIIRDTYIYVKPMYSI
jgi:hypothetical protein